MSTDWVHRFALQIGVVAAFIIVRLADVYRKTPKGQPRRDWMRSMAPKIACVVLYLVFVIAGCSALIRFDAAILQKLPFALRYALVVPLGLPVIFGVMMLSLRLAQWLTRTAKPRYETRQIALPGERELERWSPPLTLHVKAKTRQVLLWCTVGYALVFVVCGVLLVFKFSDGGFQGSLGLAVATLWSGVAAVMMGNVARPIGRISDSHLYPRFGRAIHWSAVARAEEQRESNEFNEKGAFSVMFRNAKGALLWQFPLGEIDENDLQELRRLFPDLN